MGSLPMSVVANEALVRRFVEEVLAGGDFGVLAELTACTCIDHAAAAGRPTGLAGIAPLMVAWRAAFPDLVITIEDLVGEGDTVAVRSTLRGTHRGAFLGVPPTGRHRTVMGMAFYRLAGGWIVERWATVDTLEVLRQLGAPVGDGAAAPGAPPTRAPS